MFLVLFFSSIVIFLCAIVFGVLYATKIAKKFTDNESLTKKDFFFGFAFMISTWLSIILFLTSVVLKFFAIIN